MERVMKSQTEVLWTEFSQQLKQFILKRVSDEAIAEDILQDVFVKIHANVEALEDTGNLRAWIYQITRNTVIDYYRRHNMAAQLVDIFPETEPTTSENLANDVARTGFKAMIEALPAPYAEALLLTEYEGLSQTELAEHLGITVSGAKSRVQRARKMLEEQMEKCCRFTRDCFGNIADATCVEPEDQSTTTNWE